MATIDKEEPTGDRQAALDELREIVFSDGAGAVCQWVNKHQETIRKYLSAPDHAEGVEWQPIETCPTGRPVMLGRAVGKRCVMTPCFRIDKDLFTTGAIPFVDPTHWAEEPPAPTATPQQKGGLDVV